MRRSSCWVGPQILPPFLPSLVQPPPPMRLDPPPAVRFDPSPAVRFDPPPDDATRAAPSAIAVHEASHTIAALGYDIELSHAEVDHAAGVGVARTIGLLSGRHPFPFSDLVEPFGQLVVSLAGYVGEEILLGAPPRRDESVDGRRAAQIAGFIAGAWDAGSIAPVLADGRAAACEVIGRNRDAIEAVAAALDRRGFLSGDQIAAIAGPVTAGPTRAQIRAVWRLQQQRVAHHLSRHQGQAGPAPAPRRTSEPVARPASLLDAVRQLGGSLVMQRSFTLTRSAGFDPSTSEGDAVLSTGAACRRRDWDSEYDELLDMSPKAIRLARINAGGPVLDSHRHGDGITAMIGTLVPGSVRIEGSKLVGRVKLSKNCELGRRIARDLADGHSFSFSLGYRVHKYSEQRSGAEITRTAVDWEPLEASIVTVPAEGEGTGFRVAA